MSTRKRKKKKYTNDTLSEEIDCKTKEFELTSQKSENAE